MLLGGGLGEKRRRHYNYASAYYQYRTVSATVPVNNVCDLTVRDNDRLYDYD